MDGHLTSKDQVFDALGGIQGVADLTNSKYKAAAAWRALPTFPSKHYLVMTDALERAGKTADPSLWGMTERAEPERIAS